MPACCMSSAVTFSTSRSQDATPETSAAAALGPSGLGAGAVSSRTRAGITGNPAVGVGMRIRVPASE